MKIKNKKKVIEKIFILIVSILSIIIFTATLSAQYARSFSAYTQNPTIRSEFGKVDFPLFNKEMCGAGQDFLLQVSPSGCIPAVVRSDLLEEQNVPVFCPIVATQLNPLIEIESIKHISLSGRVPPEVVGVGYQPARAALAKPEKRIDSPVFNNLGYAIIVLKRQPNESKMPDFVEGNLTARITYDIENAFGVGRAVFYLPEMSQSEWDQNFVKYSFWDGRGYLRAESIDDKSATISVYSDREAYKIGKSGEKRIIAKVNLDLEKNKESHQIYLPGFNYCLGTLSLKLEDITSPDERALLNVDGNSFELKEGASFLDNRCRILDLDKKGIVQKVKISCREDDGAKTFILSINPKIELEIDGESKSYSLGDKLYSLNDGRSVYLVYVNQNENKEDLMVIVAALRSSTEKLSDQDLDSFNSFFGRYTPGEIKNLGSLVSSVLKFGLSRTENFLRHIIEDQSFEPLSTQEITEKFVENGGKKIKFIGFSGPQDENLDLYLNDKKFEDSYKNALKDYDEIINSFSNEKDINDASREATLGEKTLSAKIEFLNSLGQKRTALEECERLKETFPNSIKPKICDDNSLLANTDKEVAEVIINGKIHRISLDRIITPTFNEFGAEILVRNKTTGEVLGTLSLRKNEIKSINPETEETIQLLDLDENSAKVRLNLKKSIKGEIKEFIDDTKTLVINTPDSFDSNYIFTLQKINLKKFAKVSINPKIDYAQTNATFSFKIGIEKRAIKLTPEKTKEKIESLNNTINKLQNINSKLEDVVRIGKTACLATGSVLTFKNFISNLGGEGVARQKVMRDSGGWFEICEREVSLGKYRNVDSCLLENSDTIEKEVEEYSKAISTQNEEIKKIQSLHKIKDGFLGEDIINTTAFKEDYIDNDFKNELQKNLEQNFQQGTINIENKDIPISEIVSSINPNTISISQAKELQLNSRLLNSENPEIRERAKKQIEATLSDVWLESKNYLEVTRLSEKLPQELKGLQTTIVPSENSIEVFYNKGKTTQAIGDIPAGTPSMIVSYLGNQYVLGLEEISSGKYIVSEVYSLSGKKIEDNVVKNRIKERFVVSAIDPSQYKNQYLNPKVRYYERDPYKGLPAIVPFDLVNGWYASIKSTLPIASNIRAYDESGRVSSFWLCNVGSNGLEENTGGDDICQLINLATGQPYNQFPGLSSDEAARKTTQAIQAIAEVSKQYKPGVDRVRVFGQIVSVGAPATSVPGIQCQDIMSPKECNLLFNVCDPFVCPSSRCDLGGKYPVENVVQSGIFGSIFLCLPNFPEVKIPICLTGVHAGLDSFNTVLDSYKSCLEESLEKGKTVGICDEIYSIYLCEFGWRQATPLINYIVPQAIGSALSGSSKGGGEYLSVQDAFQKVSDSVTFFTQYYAEDSFKAFKSRSTQEVGSAICKKAFSFSYPGDGKFIDLLTAPDSPPQFYGRFEEIPFTTATNPPVSQYKVFYHIYAGKDFPAFYEVYLRGKPGSFYQDNPIRTIARGSLKAGDYITRTVDFTAPSGYNEMCIIINGKEECGFKQVTSDFGINYITEAYISSQASKTNIKTERECVSGTPNVFPLINPTLNPNVQEGVSESIDPAIYNRGIIRICATDNPGKGSDPFVGTENARWKEVGYCSDPKIKCWLDSESVKNAIKSVNLEQKTLEETNKNSLEILKKEQGYLSEKDFRNLLREISDKIPQERISLINNNINKVFFSYEKGLLILLRGNSFSEIALDAYKKIREQQEREQQIREQQEREKQLGKLERPSTTETTEAISGLTTKKINLGDKYPILKFEPGGINYAFSEETNSWYWCVKDCNDGKNWYDSKLAEFAGKTTGEDITKRVLIPELSNKDKEFIKKLSQSTYNTGLSLLIQRTNTNDEGGILNRVSFGLIKKDAKLSTDNVRYNPDGILEINQETNAISIEDLKSLIPGIPRDYRFPFYFRYNGSEWQWSASTLNKSNYNVWFSIHNFSSEKSLLDGKNSFEGIKLIFTLGIREKPIEVYVPSTEQETTQKPGTPNQEQQTSQTPQLRCSTREECQKVLGYEIVKLAQEAKTQKGISDEKVLQDTGVKNFECLTLMVANIESNIFHCGEFTSTGISGFQENNNPLYCNNNEEKVIKNLNGEESFGIMQINRKAHQNVNVLDFNENVNYAIDILINSYNQNKDGRVFTCTNTKYTGWKAALRSYNGWGCTEATKYYVESVLSQSNRNKINSLFSDICS
ncbi:MAG: hypothetical protein KatS3mg001_248 [Candidatus Pacearchaeota archaeon]|nr:MAG: hypothetical protein KatS3mg001_248 [Candidatus Pacearchaeota archaeon]